MKINDDHMYHGAALIQVAEHELFTAINSLSVNGVKSHNTYKVNDEIGLYIKYASKPTKTHDEFPFTFSTQQLNDLARINKITPKLFLALVCVKAREICCLQYQDLLEFIERRRKEMCVNEPQYTVLVTAESGKSLKVYVKSLRTKNKIIGQQKIVKRNAYPKQIFS